jgi:hypothetical protein
LGSLKERFAIPSVHGGTTLEFEGVIPRGVEGYDGTNFVAAIIGQPLSAAVDVYDVPSHRWSAFFRDLADSGYLPPKPLTRAAVAK